MIKLETMSATELYIGAPGESQEIALPTGLKRLRADHYQATLGDVACFEGAAEVVPGFGATARASKRAPWRASRRTKAERTSSR